FPPDIGGPATWVPAIASGLSALGHSVTVVTLSERASVDSYPFKVQRILRGLPLPLRMLRTILSILAKARHADVILSNGLYTEAAVAATVLGKPLVTKFVGDPVWERATNRGWTTLDFEPFQTSKQPAHIRFF